VLRYAVFPSPNDTRVDSIAEILKARNEKAQPVGPPPFEAGHVLHDYATRSHCLYDVHK